MDRTEAVAQRYLQHLGFTDIRYEPDGNVPPDFLVNGRIAVEVRRLNQHDTSASAPRGLEEVDIPLLGRMRRLCDRMGAPQSGISWSVSYAYSRPVEKWKTLGPKIEAWLQAVRSRATPERHKHGIGTFSLTAVPAREPGDREFLVGDADDEDSGGWLLYELGRSAEICIREKTSKIAAHQHRYPEWWLLLVDHIGYALTPFGRALRSERPHIAHDWQRVVLVSPLDPATAIEL